MRAGNPPPSPLSPALTALALLVGGHGHPDRYVDMGWVFLKDTMCDLSKAATSPQPRCLHPSLPLAPGRLTANLHFNHFHGGKENKTSAEGMGCLLEWSCPCGCGAGDPPRFLQESGRSISSQGTQHCPENRIPRRPAICCSENVSPARDHFF